VFHFSFAASQHHGRVMRLNVATPGEERAAPEAMHRSTLGGLARMRSGRSVVNAWSGHPRKARGESGKGKGEERTWPTWMLITSRIAPGYGCIRARSWLGSGQESQVE